jgi:hypothetical protein
MFGIVEYFNEKVCYRLIVIKFCLIISKALIYVLKII